MSRYEAGVRFMSRYEYATTRDEWNVAHRAASPGGWVEAFTPCVLVPDGEGWELCGTAAVSFNEASGMLFWTWRRAL